MNFDLELKKQSQKLLDLALKSNIKIAVAESCTGGLLCALITEIAGSSQIFDRGFITYSNLSKQQELGVETKALNDFGAVSEEVAKQMAIGAIKNSSSVLSIATTGIAGPKTDESQKPVGLTYISSFNKLSNNLITKKFIFSGNRHENRIMTVKNAIEILIENCSNKNLN
ncbi:MAG: competence/damage-inducible protein [Rickettsiaceae bacterium]|jgi:PncC family amidohydrolase|nr:competence/damage-inducible protein [Rickettsiaceae bacterium]